MEAQFADFLSIDISPPPHTPLDPPLQYMDRTYVAQQQKTPVYTLGLELWRDNVVRNAHIQQRLLAILLDLVLKERSGEVIDRGLFRSITQVCMFVGEGGKGEVWALCSRGAAGRSLTEGCSRRCGKGISRCGEGVRDSALKIAVERLSMEGCAHHTGVRGQRSNAAAVMTLLC